MKKFIVSTRFLMKQRFLQLLGLFLVAGALLVGCDLPVRTDPFETKEQELRTISGEIFPFDISVATEATHRLEKEGRLVALLASDIIPLEKFEGREVSLKGAHKTEKMREIFWVESLELLSLTDEEAEDQTEKRFLAKDFTFVFPSTWEYSTSPDGTAYFSEKGDEAKRVFLKFSVGELTSADRKLDPNVLIANLSGYKKSSDDNLKREEQDITLFSNVNSDRKYKFYFVTQFEEFEKKKDFFALLNSFVEGELAVQGEKEKDLREQAQAILEKVKEQEERQKLEEIQKSIEDGETEETEEEGDSLFSKIVEKIQTEDEGKDDEAIVEEIVEENRAEEERKKWAYNDLINANAFSYTSRGLKFSMKVPFGFWFINFGGAGGKIGVIGFADEAFSTLSQADFVLEIVEKTGGIEKIEQENNEDGTIVIKFPRPGFENSHFQFVGPASFRDAMLSIWATVQ